jgi:processive 1,2-diacylglycerol beta-glucosyltransferase
LMDPRIFHEVLTAHERRRFRVANLGLHPDRFTVFLTTGGAGANNHMALLSVLHEFADTHQAIVVCGRNHKAFVRVNEWRKEHPRLACHLEGFCDQMHLLAQVSDAIVTRGGTTTCAKALHYCCPMILNGIGGVMPQESLTTKFFLQDRAACIISRPDELRRVLREWIERPDEYRRMRAQMDSMRYTDDPEQVVRELIDLAREAANSAEKRPDRTASTSGA